MNNSPQQSTQPDSFPNGIEPDTNFEHENHDSNDDDPLQHLNNAYGIPDDFTNNSNGLQTYDSPALRASSENVVHSPELRARENERYITIFFGNCVKQIKSKNSKSDTKFLVSLFEFLDF